MNKLHETEMPSQRLLLTGQILGSIVLISGLTILVGGWLMGMSRLTHIQTGWVSLKANSAIGYILYGLIIIFLSLSKHSKISRKLVIVFGLFQFALGALNIGQYLFAVDLGIDQLLIRDPYTDLTDYPGRMSFVTAAAFFVVGLSVLIPTRESRSFQWYEVLVLITMILGYFQLLGYTNGIWTGESPALYTRMAAHNTLLLIMGGIAALLVQQNSFVVAVSSSSFAGGTVARRLIPFVVILPLFLGFIKNYAVQFTIFDLDLAWSLVVTLNTSLIIGMAFFTAKRLNVCERVRLDALDELARKTREAAELLNSSSVAKADFLRNLSHELRTPLTSILGFSELLKDPNATREQHGLYIDTIIRNGKNLSLLINDVLDLSEMDAGNQMTALEPVNIAASTKEVLQMFMPQVIEKGIRFDLRIAPAVPNVIQSDATRFRQILLNVVGNAVKFSHQGTITIQVDAQRNASGSAEDQLNVLVRDQGIGIGADQHDCLFIPFSQVDNSTTRRYSGTGLGLSLSRKLANALGGDVALVESTLGVGSCFLITLRYDPGTAKALDIPTPPEQAVIPSLVARPQSREILGWKILVTDDAQDTQMLLRRILLKHGAEVELADDGREAVDKGSHTRYDVILMDMQMPVMDGYEATALLRMSGYAGPILALTAHAMNGEKERALLAGCSEYLTKPISTERLIDALSHYAKHTSYSSSLTGDGKMPLH